MKVWLKNQVRKYVYREFDYMQDVDLDVLCDEDSEKLINVYLGENGVGKTFLFESLVYLACLYNGNDIDYGDGQKIITRLYDSGVGEILIGKSDYREKVIEDKSNFIISVKTSYYPEDVSRVVEEPLKEEGEVLTEEEKKYLEDELAYRRKFCRFYTFSISARTKDFFDKHKFVYYANTQFPSSIEFYTEKSLSIYADNEDCLIYWNIIQPSKSKYKLAYSVNFSGISIFPELEIKAENMEEKDVDSLWNGVKRKYKWIDNDVDGLIKDIFSSQLYNTIKKSQESKDLFLRDEFELNEESMRNFLLLLLLKEKYGTIEYEMLCESNEGKYIPYKLLNSGKKYNLTLEYLNKICNKSTILFIDEPENSLHLKTQEAAMLTSFGCALNLITHSPAFISSIVCNHDIMPILHVMTEENGVVDVDLTTDSAVNKLSLDSIAAEYLGYSPFLDCFCEKNEGLDPANLMSINDFYESIK